MQAHLRSATSCQLYAATNIRSVKKLAHTACRRTLTEDVDSTGTPPPPSPAPPARCSARPAAPTGVLAAPPPRQQHHVTTRLHSLPNCNDIAYAPEVAARELGGLLTAFALAADPRRAPKRCGEHLRQVVQALDGARALRADVAGRGLQAPSAKRLFGVATCDSSARFRLLEFS
ncbi:hypothetical protein ON010_g17228 [Phytophthora cinnamomi]|nr:hypothetical protein ON010_g17228 [Phytophthora cinnamomi]